MTTQQVRSMLITFTKLTVRRTSDQLSGLFTGDGLVEAIETGATLDEVLNEVFSEVRQELEAMNAHRVDEAAGLEPMFDELRKEAEQKAKRTGGPAGPLYQVQVRVSGRVFSRPVSV